ncbi:MAG TPA: dickkopf-related protein [archaeon]|nr:dickkopf-related protein [archaeon]
MALAIWSTAHEGKIIGQFIKGDGTLRGGNVILGSHNEFVGEIKIVYDNDDDLFLVVWGAAAGNNMGPTYGTLVKPNGMFVKQNFIIMNNCGVGAHASSLGNIAYSKDARKFYVTCTRGVITRGIIVGNSVMPDGTVGNEVVVASSGYGSSVAAGGSNVLVTWADSNQIGYGMLYDTNGAPLSSPIQVSTGALGGYGGIVPFYNVERNDYDIFYWESYGGRFYKRSVTNGVLGAATAVTIGSNVGVSDIAYNPLTGSYFVADQHWNDNGNGYVEIRSSGTVSASVDTAEDLTKPHYTPAITATKNNMPLTIMNRAGDALAQFGGLGGAVSGGKLRTCNGMTTISVGSGNDCPDQGACLVSVFARDTNGNIGTPNSRSFNIKLIFTNITTPLDGSNQTGNFSVNVQDRDFASTTNSTLTCTYDVYSIGSSSTKTVDNAARRCNSNFTVSIGPDGDCTLMGQGSCKVVAKINKTMNGTRIEDTSTRFYNIDWVTPYSEIVSAPSNWVTSDFTISVRDNAQGVASRISKCQYKVVSNITQTVPWTDRTCGIGTPVDIPITVGAGKNCRHEGGDACTIYVRPIDRAGNPGIEDNVSVPIIFEVTDINGFSNMLTVQTERGLNFSGTTRQALRLYTFYVCNKNSNINSCISAYDSNNKGPDMPNFCGSLFGKCEMRCSDRTVSYYFAARGTPVGQTTTATVVSPIMTASCPTFNIDKIDEWYQIFTRLEVQIGTEIGIVDSCIIQNGESEICNAETLAILEEALLITKDHLRNMTLEMQDLTVTRAAQLIARSLEKRDDISALLGKIRPPTQVVMTVDMPEVVRFNRNMDLTATVNKNGPGTAYGTFYCTIRKPGALAPQESRSSCLSLGSAGQYTTTYTVPFMPDRLGTWTYSCILGRSIRSDCSFEVNQTPVGGTFAVLPAASTFISSLSAPASVVKGSIATIDAVVTNPDSSSRFVNVTCNFKYMANGQLITKRNSSTCISAAENADTTAAINMYGGTLGEWNATGCSVYSSSLSSCASSTLDNVSLDTASYMVILPDTVFIESVGVPQVPVLNNSLLSIPVIINNPTQDVAYVTLDCGIIKPVGSLTITDQNGVDSGRTSSFTLDTTTDRVGRWNISSCSVSVSPDPSFLGGSVVYTLNNVGTFNVIARNNLTINSVDASDPVQNNTLTSLSVSVTNPSNTRYGRVSCTVRDPVNRVHVNSSACLIVNSNAQRVFPINFFMNRTGEWHITQCSVYGSASADCSSYSLHDRTDFIDNSFNSTVSCNAGLYSAINPATGICQEFGNNCNIPAGWINITAGSCPAGPGVVYISSVSVPTTDVINNSNVNIDTLVSNPVNDDRFAQVSCFVKNPLGSLQLLTSSCEGISAINTRTYRTTLTVNKVGVWNVTTCSVNASTSCASATLQHSFNASKTMNVIRGINLSFVSFVLPPDTLVNSGVQLQAVIRNPSDAARYARVFCSFRNPQNQMTSNSTSCLQVAGTSTPTFGVNIFANIAGTWNVDSCTLRGSLDSSCSELHDSESGIGAFNITTISPPPALAELFISDITANPTALNGSQINVLVYGRNNNLANSSYAIVGCEFLNPLGGLTRQASSCMQVTANSTVRFGVSQLLNIPGTWTVRNCFINASNTNNCAPSILNNVSAETRTITVSLPPNLYITGVTAPSTDVVNNTNVNIDVFVSNPLTDDKYGFVNCIIQDPNGNNYTRTTACSSVPRQTSNKRYNVSVFANVVGSWNVKNCSVSSSTSSSCASSSPAGEIINGDTFNVIRGYNLTLSSLSVPQPAYANQPLRVAYTLRNPSTSDRFAHVTCTMTKGGQNIINASSCMTIGPESFIDNNAMFVPSSTGAWTVSCAAERSFDASCSSLEVHDRVSENFNVTYPPDLYIQSIDVTPLALKDYEVFASLRIRNPAITNIYGFAQCAFKNRLNETTYNASECLNMTADTTIVSLGVTPALRGNWTVYNCYVNATTLSNCSSSRVHNISTVEKSFNVYAPVLSFVGGITLASSNLMVGDIADVVVNVKNTGERAYLTFVNCTLINPLGVSYMLTTAPQTLQIDETRDFHPQRQVDVSGTWKVGSCSIYSISSPPKLEASKVVNQIFDVLYAGSTDECNSNVPCQTGFTCESGTCVAILSQCSASNCPGTNQGCYCSNDRCVSCGQGYTCSQARCVPETPVINTCRASSDCTTGNVCVNGVCQQKPVECYSDGDCGINYACKSGNCVVNVQKPILDEKIIYFLIILLAVIMVPIILFIYIKRAI